MVLSQLMEGHRPNKIFHRDEQINSIKQVFNNFRKFGTGNNLILMGVTGSGKTTTIKQIITEEENFIFISANKKKRALQILRLISENNTNQTDLILQGAIDRLRLEGKILIIDELNKLEDVKTLFDDLNTIYREVSIPIILITNNLAIIKEIPDDARLTLFFEKISFPAYNAYELYDIIIERLNELSLEFRETIPEESLKYICAISAKEGSARTVLDLLRRCLMAHDFSFERIDKFIREEEMLEMETFVSSLGNTEKNFLKVIVDLYALKVGKDEDITTYDIRNKMGGLNPSRTSQLITTFEKDYGIIKSSWVEKGRKGGRYRVINFISQDTYAKLEGII